MRRTIGFRTHRYWLPSESTMQIGHLHAAPGRLSPHNPNIALKTTETYESPIQIPQMHKTAPTLQCKYVALKDHFYYDMTSYLRDIATPLVCVRELHLCDVFRKYARKTHLIYLYIQYNFLTSLY